MAIRRNPLLFDANALLGMTLRSWQAAVLVARAENPEEDSTLVESVERKVELQEQMRGRVAVWPVEPGLSSELLDVAHKLASQVVHLELAARHRQDAGVSPELERQLSEEEAEELEMARFR